MLRNPYVSVTHWTVHYCLSSLSDTLSSLSLDDSVFSLTRRLRLLPHSIVFVAPSSLSVRRLSRSVVSVDDSVVCLTPSSLSIRVLCRSVRLLCRSVFSLAPSSSNQIRDRFRFHFLTEASLPPASRERVLHFHVSFRRRLSS